MASTHTTVRRRDSPIGTEPSMTSSLLPKDAGSTANLSEKSDESFEFIETPQAPVPHAAPYDCGVRTTTVRAR